MQTRKKGVVLKKEVRDQVNAKQALWGQVQATTGLGDATIYRALHTDTPMSPHTWLIIFKALNIEVTGEWYKYPTKADERIYRRWLKDRTDTIDIKGIGNARGPLTFSLLDLYTRLSTYMPNAPEQRISLEEAVRLCSTPGLVIQGDPGSGKTTFLRYLARTMAESPNDPLTLHLQIPELYAFITREKRTPSVPIEASVKEWFLRFWLEQSMQYGWQFDEEWLNRQLEEGRVWNLMDSFDELSSESSRIEFATWLENLSITWPKARWILTSRPLALVGQAKPSNYTYVKIDSLQHDGIEAFIIAWICCVYNLAREEVARHDQARREAVDLMRAIRDRPDVYRLSHNPLMLTAMAVVHFNQKRLPQGKANLYEAVIKWLIDARKRDTTSAEMAYDCYRHLALAMCQHPVGRQIRIGCGDAATQIAHLFPGTTAAQQKQNALKFLSEEADVGIIVYPDGAVEGDIEFKYLSMQEYLCASAIASNLDPPNTESWWSLIEPHLDDPAWREILGFVPVRLASLGKRRVDLFITQILSAHKSHNASLQEKARVVGLLAGILENLAVFDYHVDHIPDYIAIRTEVMQIFDQSGLAIDLTVRYDAAVALGRGGDPRITEANNWRHIPGGIQWLGAQKASPDLTNYDEFAEDKEHPVFQTYTGSFEIGRFPVTVQEFARFVDDGGYENAEFWLTKASWLWRLKNRISMPNRWSKQQEYPNCPVVYVNWYEAQAYCLWLTMRDETWNYRLPTESEWEYVARRGQQQYTPYCFGNIYPLDIKDEICWEGGTLKHICPVGLFPLDSSYDGIQDINGNVLQWMQDGGPSSYLPEQTPARLCRQPESEFRYLRGGRWNQGIARLLRTANRACVNLHNRYDDVGFRVVRTRKPIRIKNQQPTNEYLISLADIYAKHSAEVYSRQEADRLLELLSINISSNIIDKLFPADMVLTPRHFDRMPFVMGKVAPTKLDFNLLYQDTRIKLAVEQKVTPAFAKQDATKLMEAVAILLRSKGVSHDVLWKDLTDNDLDALLFEVLKNYDPNRMERLLNAGHSTNSLALESLAPRESLSLTDRISYQIFAGTVWWLEKPSVLEEQFASERNFAINDIERFQQDVQTGKRNMIFFVDDNGELVWDLSLIEELLCLNSQLVITCIVSSQAVANNACEQTLYQCLDHQKLKGLQSLHGQRFKVFTEDNFRSAIDPCFCSDELVAILKEADVAFIKGVALFETMQMLPVDAYYAFVVHSDDSQKHTGLTRGQGVLVYVPRETKAYEPSTIIHRHGGDGGSSMGYTLKDIYPKLSS